MQNIAYNIKNLRKARGMTQEELASQLHVTRQAISSWERGNSCPDFDTLKALAEILDATPEQLLYGAGNGKKAAYHRVRYLGPILLAIAGYLLCVTILNPFDPTAGFFVSQLYLCILIVGSARAIIDELRNRDYYREHPDGLPPSDDDE